MLLGKLLIANAIHFTMPLYNLYLTGILRFSSEALQVEHGNLFYLKVTTDVHKRAEFSFYHLNVRRHGFLRF